MTEVVKINKQIVLLGIVVVIILSILLSVAVFVGGPWYAVTLLVAGVLTLIVAATVTW